MRAFDPSKTYLITGGAGFIGFHLSKKLLEQGAGVIGFDNMNDYYDVKLKEDRLAILETFDNYSFVKGDLSDNADVFRIFQEHKPQIAVNLGAQAGVRYSIDNPTAYMESNMMGFFHILEACRFFPVEHLVYASSSS
ncbi:MAG: GDP-mannose 4,6-dehydratase, partial [Lachnospiraceae bacterium]|nr:GDP-mannose 4,6-dehydratase [Lachnospiraceae bacterium]